MAGAAKPKPAPAVSRLARAAARKTLKAIARKALQSGAAAARTAAERTAELGKEAWEAGFRRQPPIQVSIDVAVPLAVAWEEWVGSSWLTEGVHRVKDVQRDGAWLIGTTGGRRATDWEAEILDERENESIAWRSVTGSDCAGLATFHRLSERLTRIELDLDVVPTGPAQAAALSLHVAHRRAQADLRRFKAHVEFISPDVYEPQLSGNGGSPEGESDHEGRE